MKTTRKRESRLSRIERKCDKVLMLLNRDKRKGVFYERELRQSVKKMRQMSDEEDEHIRRLIALGR